MILPLGSGGSHVFLAENESHIYPNMCAKFGCGPTVVSEKNGGYRQTNKGKLQLYIIDLPVTRLRSGGWVGGEGGEGGRKAGGEVGRE